ncbi:hypothetical protein RRG08_002320 [Elysia crispata]|uniref:Uncharacterized protein n=1 Tax=Elysia crispata TaxID=231223 RepID=A0AAE0ZAX6_9GAST|nr:hypothetical protein RRG08_002320 [Elysia crispata]
MFIESGVRVLFHLTSSSTSAWMLSLASATTWSDTPVSTSPGRSTSRDTPKAGKRLICVGHNQTRVICLDMPLVIISKD